VPTGVPDHLAKGRGIRSGDLRHYHAGTNVKVMCAKRQVFYYVSKYMGKFQESLPCPFPGQLTESKRLNSCGFSGKTSGRSLARDTRSSPGRCTAFAMQTFGQSGFQSCHSSEAIDHGLKELWGVK
jgi:hypothetical protein